MFRSHYPGPDVKTPAVAKLREGNKLSPTALFGGRDRHHSGCAFLGDGMDVYAFRNG